jgi:hypothetical protein
MRVPRFDSESVQLFDSRIHANGFTPRMCIKSQFFVPADVMLSNKSSRGGNTLSKKGETAYAISPEYGVDALRFRATAPDGGLVIRDVRLL